MKLDDLRGWLEDARSGRVQTVAVGLVLPRWWREGLWAWPPRVERFKGSFTIAIGPVFVEFGG